MNPTHRMGYLDSLCNHRTKIFPSAGRLARVICLKLFSSQEPLQIYWEN